MSRYLTPRRFARIAAVAFNLDCRVGFIQPPRRRPRRTVRMFHEAELASACALPDSHVGFDTRRSKTAAGLGRESSGGQPKRRHRTGPTSKYLFTGLADKHQTAVR
jgi:hypothetical protein